MMVNSVSQPPSGTFSAFGFESVGRRQRAEDARLRRRLDAHVQSLGIAIDGVGAEVAGHRAGRQVLELGFDGAVQLDELPRQVGVGGALRRAGLAGLAWTKRRSKRFERAVVAPKLDLKHLAAVEGVARLAGIVGVGGKDRQDADQLCFVATDRIAGDSTGRHELQRARIPGRLLRRARRLGLRRGRRGKGEEHQQSSAGRNTIHCARPT